VFKRLPALAPEMGTLNLPGNVLFLALLYVDQAFRNRGSRSTQAPYPIG